MRNRNKKSKGRTVLNQHLSEIRVKKRYSNEESPYWEWTFQNGYQTAEGEYQEHNRANPDVLPIKDSDYLERQNGWRELFWRAKELMTPRERTVFSLLDELNQGQIAVRLGITQQAVSMTIRRIRKKILRAGCELEDNVS